MLTPFGVILIGTGLLFACLFAIYLFSIRINGKENAKYDENSSNGSLIKSSKKNKKKVKESARDDKQPLPLVSPVESNEVLAKFDEEDDVIALASLKGYDTTGLRRRSPENAKIVETEKAKVVKKAKVVEKEKIVEKGKIVKVQEVLAKSEISTSEATLFESVDNVIIEEWSHVPTREEEVVKNLKNKLAVLEAEIEESERKSIQNSRALEQSQKRINLLEQELKEQRKLSTGTKAALEAQIISLRAINNEMAGKLVSVEADALNVSILKNEFERSKEANSRLQSELHRAQDEKSEFFRQISELKTENGFLREQAYLADSLNEKCAALEEELEEARRQMELQVETSQTELKLTRAKLESEIAFHRAEHANSVGSSTALHQEIAQLKSEIINLTDSENNAKSKAEEFEKLNLQLLKKIEESKEFESQIQIKNDEISKLENYLETTKSELIALESEITVLKETLKSAKALEPVESLDSSEILNLRNQLAEAEIKISSLQADLTREIKRADIAKKVYETKLAMLEKA